MSEREARRQVVVVGGANTDVKARSGARVVRGTSNPGSVTESPGGVGRNVAECLARLGTTTHLVAAVGDDERGARLLEQSADAGVGVDHAVRRAGATGRYVAVLDADGELEVAVAAMSQVALTVDDVTAAGPLLGGAAMVVLDGNLAPDVVLAAWTIAADAGVPVVLDPVSVPKARALAPLLDGARPLFAVTPNLDELEALGEVEDLHARGVAHVWVRLGADGSTLYSAGEDPLELAVVPAPGDEVADVTGAGDAMLAAFVHALQGGDGVRRAARLGHAAAALTVASPHTVRPDLSPDLLRSLL